MSEDSISLRFAPLLAHCGGIVLDDLHLISTSTLQLAFDTAKTSLADRMALEVLLARQKATATAAVPQPSSDATAVLAQHFKDRERRELEPWWKEVEHARSRLKYHTDQHSSDDRRKRFIALAKDAQLTMTEALMGTYLIFGSATSQSVLANLCCFELPEDRIRLHNVYVADNTRGGFMDQYGKTILALDFPLFPPVEELEALNLRLLREFAHTASGGAPSRPPSLFRSAVTGVNERIDGGGSLPVVQDANGTYCIDTTQIEQAFQQVFEHTTWLNNQVMQLQQEKVPLEKLAASVREGLGKIKSQVGRAQRLAIPQPSYRPRSPSRTSAPRRASSATSRYRRPRGGETSESNF